MTEEVILVDINDNEIGTMLKMEAHLLGKLHRAFSIFVFNTKAELLLQQRAFDKYHSGGKWTNTCCSHPRQGEETIDAARRRLKEEMGLVCEIEYAFSFTYRAELSDGISEYEYDHVFFGLSDHLPELNPEEVANYRYMSIDKLAIDIEAFPDNYTEWLKICFNRVAESYHKIF